MSTETRRDRQGSANPEDRSDKGPVKRRNPFASWKWDAKHICFAVVTIAIVYLVGGPVLYLLWGTFFDENGFTLDAFVRAFGEPGAIDTIWNTAAFTVGSALVAMVLGTALAYLQARTDVPMKGLLYAASLMPLVLPPVVYAIAWVFLYGGEVGIVSGFLTKVFGSSPVGAYGLMGMIMASGLHIVPMVFLFMVPAFKAMDPSLEEAARVAGATWFGTLRRVTVPLIRPGLIAAAVIVLVLGLESFEIPAILGETTGTSVFTSRIYFLLQGFPSDVGAAGAVSIAIMAMAMLLIYGTGGGKGSTKEFQTISGKGFKPAPVKLGRFKGVACAGVLLFFFIAVVAPVLALIYVSLSPFYQAPTWDALTSMNMNHYIEMSEVRGIGTALGNTVLVALISATVVMFLTSLASWFVVRSNFKLRKFLDTVALIPLVIPGLVLGLGLMFVYLRSPLPIYGTLAILVIAYVTRFLPYGMRYTGAAMAQISNELEEAAHVSGATWWGTFRKVVLPLAAPGILSGWIFVLLVSFRELSSTVLLAGPNSEVLSVILFRQFNEGTFGVVAAMSVMMLLILGLIIAVAYRVGSRFGAKVEL